MTCSSTLDIQPRSFSTLPLDGSRTHSLSAKSQIIGRAWRENVPAHFRHRRVAIQSADSWRRNPKSAASSAKIRHHSVRILPVLRRPLMIRWRASPRGRRRSQSSQLPVSEGVGMVGHAIPWTRKPRACSGSSVSGGFSGRGMSAAPLVLRIRREVEALAVALSDDRHQLGPHPAGLALGTDVMRAARASCTTRQLPPLRPTVPSNGGAG